MASWLRLFLLNTITVSIFVMALWPLADIRAEEKTPPLQIQSEQLIQPEIERRNIKLHKIDSEDFEATVFTGLLNIEDFGTNIVYGARFAYHINEDLFVEATLATSKAGLSSYERIDGISLMSDSERQMLYYNISVGYNLLPGESFLTRNTSFNSALYVVAGIGSTEFAGSDKLTLNVGGGFRLLATDWMALHIDVRDHIFNLDITAEDKTTNNLEVTIGLSAFF